MTTTHLDIAPTRARFAEVASGHVCDALSKLGVLAPALPDAIHPLTAQKRIAGPAVTLQLVRARSADEPRNLVHTVDTAVGQGSILVVDADGCCDWSLFGSRLAERMLACGGAGAVVNGAIRDIRTLDALRFPVHARGRNLFASEGRFHGIGIDVPVAIDAVPIHPGDWIVGDEAGLCVVPAALVADVLRLAEERERIDDESLGAIRAGSTLDSVHTHFEDE